MITPTPVLDFSIHPNTHTHLLPGSDTLQMDVGHARLDFRHPAAMSPVDAAAIWTQHIATVQRHVDALLDRAGVVPAQRVGGDGS